MENTHDEDQLPTHYEKQLAPYHLSQAQILEIRQAVMRIAAQIMDHYLDHLDDS